MKEKKASRIEQTGEASTKDLSRRQFFRNCGLVLLATASYSVLSVFEQKPARADKTEVAQDYDCFEYCMSDCTGCTAGCTANVIVPCYDCTSDYIYDVPPVPEPTCVMYFSGCETDCQYNCTAST
jgi:hypothetical protein